SSSRNQLLGLAVAAIGGVAAVLLSDVLSIGVVVYAALVAGVSAWLLRTWWTLLTVPLVYFVGYLVGAVIDAWGRGSLYSVDCTLQYRGRAVIVFALIHLLPLLIGDAIVTAVGKRMARK